jgi:hypothetical protein
VDVGVGHRGDDDAGLLRRPLHRPEVAGRVDDQGPRAVVDEVASVAELGYLDRDDLHRSP